MSHIDEILTERGKRYGAFDKHAAVTQSLKDTMKFYPGWRELSPSQKEALEMIAHKIGRIINGDPDYIDSWDDIAGYAKLVADELRGPTEQEDKCCDEDEFLEDCDALIAKVANLVDLLKRLERGAILVSVYIPEMGAENTWALLKKVDTETVAKGCAHGIVRTAIAIGTGPKEFVETVSKRAKKYERKLRKRYEDV
ncbi:hypothetical protein [Nitratifractor salsuginis]|uniref:Uncharacterized protein n=1 Tax=Nitratifractor salsuginis (strain DSM 16511 / JCM 12458 / E9I37-1) TaxID=749222 RepID=E6X1R9_NITSE|nr:hypothetical protein [Nitratifractor salsuginis]ADV47060.1 hypothetical protein Nitsa_1815 [Nitratifractor salsuginis DSM 16511]